MIQIRKNVFETNSSSTHSIAIPKTHSGNYPQYVCFGIGEYGWEFNQEDPASYLYTAILSYYVNPEEREEKLDKLKSVLDAHGIKYRFDSPRFRFWKGEESNYEILDNGYIDHSSNLGPFLKAVFADDYTLLNFIFYGLVFTGNDNCTDDQYDYVHRNEPISYTYPDKEENPNPYYTDEYKNYDWYMKDN